MEEITELAKTLENWSGNIGAAQLTLILLTIVMLVGAVVIGIAIIRWGKPSIQNAEVFIKTMMEAYQKSALTQVDIAASQKELVLTQHRIAQTLSDSLKMMTAIEEQMNVAFANLNAGQQTINKHLDMVVIGIPEQTAEQVLKRLHPFLEALDSLAQRNNTNHDELMRSIEALKKEVVDTLSQTIELHVAPIPKLPVEEMTVEGTA